MDFHRWLRAARESCLALIAFSTPLFSDSIHTFYGPIEVEEEVLLELIESPPFQRLREIHQYGVAYFIRTHAEEYTRFDHSLGVFALLRAKGASLEEQIAGLLHDVSHTAFSHVGDWVFAKENQEDDYQNSIHDHYLISCGIEEILQRHGFTVAEVSPKRIEFQMLEQPLPNLCADRIDYNIQGAYYQNFLSLEEARALFADLAFSDGRWIISKPDLAKQLAQFSLFMTKDCWGSATNYLASRWLADAIIRAIDLGVLTNSDFHYGIDQEIWDFLLAANDPLILDRMDKLAHPTNHFSLITPIHADLLIPFRCRGIDPWIAHQGGICRLSAIDPLYERELKETQKQAVTGWAVKLSGKEGE